MSLSSDIGQKYQPTIGIECHVQLKTRTKLFAAVANDARGAKANTLISHICVGMPGALPVLNQAVIELSARAAFALGTQPQKFTRFERKHYFYPDLPKGYQITQYEQSIIKGGFVEINVDGQPKRISIERANLEEDAGKNIHPAGASYTLVDLNRSGTPLLEIVSAPEISSAAEAKAYARELWLLMKYADVTDGDLYHGHVRFDVNISVSSDVGNLGTRSEIKNLNSFRSVENAVAYEIERQVEVLQKGGEVIQETRGWDESKQKSFSQRIKEEAEDYRYMPEPDVPPLELDDAFMSKQRDSMPELPSQIRQKLQALNIENKVIEDILDNPAVYYRVSQAIKHGTSAENIRRVAFDSLETTEAHQIDVKDHIEVAEMQRTKMISSNAAKHLIAAKANHPDKSVHNLAQEMNLHQESDESAIEKIVDEVIIENPKVVEDIKAGQDRAIGFLVGQVMQKSGGRANPGLANQIIKQKLGL